MIIKSKLFISFLVLILVFAVFVIRDASKIFGVKFSPVGQSEYQVTLKGKNYVLKYVAKEKLSPLFGKAFYELGIGYALVRDDLPKGAKKFVASHEIYHLQDFAGKHSKSKIVQEIHANLGALLYHPIGFMEVVWLTLSNPSRMSFYSGRYF